MINWDKLSPDAINLYVQVMQNAYDSEKLFAHQSKLEADRIGDPKHPVYKIVAALTFAGNDFDYVIRGLKSLKQHFEDHGHVAQSVLAGYMQQLNIQAESTKQMSVILKSMGFSTDGSSSLIIKPPHLRVVKD